MTAEMGRALEASAKLEYLERLEITSKYNPLRDVQIPKLVLLKDLKLRGGAEACDLTNCLYMPKLERIKIVGMVLDNLEELKNCRYLREIALEVCNITDISGLKNCSWLEEVTLDANTISDITVLAGKEYIKYLNLSNNIIRDISPLENCHRIYELDIGGNPIANVDAIYAMPVLRHFNFEDTDCELSYELRQFLWMIEERWN